MSIQFHFAPPPCVGEVRSGEGRRTGVEKTERGLEHSMAMEVHITPITGAEMNVFV